MTPEIASVGLVYSKQDSGAERQIYFYVVPGQYNPMNMR